MNKGINYLLILISIVFTFECSYSQNASEDQQALEMLKEFYIAQSKIRFIPENMDKIESLQKKYCTKEYQKKIKEQFQLTGFDHDLLTKDYGIDSLGLKTLTISKDPKQNNNYIVSYTILDDYFPKVSKVEVKVLINVTVKKEDHILKIDDIR